MNALLRACAHLAAQSSCLAALGAWLVAAGCGDKVTIIECPPGTYASGSECISFDAGPPGDPDTGGGGGGAGDVVAVDDAGTDSGFPVVVPDEGPLHDADAPDSPDTLVGEDSDGSASAGDADARAGAGDAGGSPADVPTGPSVGDPCQTNAQCGDGGSCLDWPGGYCTFLDCAASGGCPEGTICALLSGGNTGCVLACDGPGTCPEGRGCKPVPVVGAGEQSACWGVAEDAGAVGAPCAASEACEADLTCWDAVPGGYCTRLECDGGCPVGSKCATYGDTPACLAECAAVEDCATGPGADRACETLGLLDGGAAGLCISGVSGAAIGAACTSDFGCASGTCEILGAGRCSLAGTPCDPDTELADCGSAEYCNVTGEPVGRCTQPCSVSAPCPGATRCAGTPGEPDGVCRVPCEGLGPFDDCPGADGFVCTFGHPLGDATGQGQYLCHRAGGGGFGASCGLAATCSVGACVPPDGGGSDGTCVVTCDEDLYCPFPGTCMASPGGTPMCRVACLTAADCADGFSCTTPTGSFKDVCH